nr:STARP-like antigen [Hymenolepis microstoma]
MDSSSQMPLFSANTNQQVPPILTNALKLVYSVPAFPVLFTNGPTNKQQPKLRPILPSPSGSDVSKTSAHLSELERTRKDKKKHLERMRRSKIIGQIKTMYDLVFEMSGEQIRKTELCDMLMDCLTVLESVYKTTREDQILKDRILPPELLSSSTVSPMNEEGNQNTPPNSSISTSSPGSADLSSILTTSTPTECRKRKRESADSGLEQLNPSTFSSLSNSSLSWSRESPSVKKSKITLPHIWRPFQE